jgi:peptide chain release factor 1
MRSLASDEFKVLSTMLSQQIDTVFPRLLIPPSATAHLSALIELKSGVGGSESSLFLAELLRMYTRLANSMKWKTQLLTSNELDVVGGGVKDAILEIDGQGSYDTLRWESGVHRVQRVPATEASGRVHTSTVAVLVSSFIHCKRTLTYGRQVFPVSESTEESSELFSMEDVKLEVMRARGAGGQVRALPFLVLHNTNC